MKRDRTPVGEAADIVAHELIKHNKPVGFGTLEDQQTKETSGVVLVCLDSTKVEAVIRFVHSLGNFHTTVVPERSAER